MKKEFVPNITDLKILITVDYLNKLGYYPLPLGVLKILSGIEDEETLPFIQCPTFGVLTSFNSKKISRLVMMLTRYDYLGKTYDEKTNELYLEILQKGEAYITYHLKNRKLDLTKKTTKKKVSIVQIEKN